MTSSDTSLRQSGVYWCVPRLSRAQTVKQTEKGVTIDGRTDGRSLADTKSKHSNLVFVRGTHTDIKTSLELTLDLPFSRKLIALTNDLRPGPVKVG